MEEIFHLAQNTLTKNGFDFSVFPHLAVDLLNSLDPRERSRLLQIFQGIGRNVTFRIYSNEHISLNVHYWPQGITNCHNHQFSGAFRIIQGRAFHIKWSFAQKDNVTDFMSLGILKLESMEMIDTNKVQPIELEMVHQLVYLDRPTFSLQLRTKDFENYAMDEFFHPGMKIKANQTQLNLYMPQISQVSSLGELFQFLENIPESIVIGVYSGTIVAHNPMLRDHFPELQEHIKKKYSDTYWFNLYLDYVEKHRIFMNKLLITHHGNNDELLKDRDVISKKI